MSIGEGNVGNVGIGSTVPPDVARYQELVRSRIRAGKPARGARDDASTAGNVGAGNVGVGSTAPSDAGNVGVGSTAPSDDAGNVGAGNVGIGSSA